MEDIRNAVIVADDIGTSGQPTREQFAAIRRAGFDAVINLAMHDSDDALPDEGAVVAALGMTYIHLPVPFDRPDEEHLRRFCRLMEALRGRRVWVHCAMNFRVSAFVWHYLHRVRGLSETEARSPMFERWQPNAVWRDFLDLAPARESLL